MGWIALTILLAIALIAALWWRHVTTREHARELSALRSAHARQFAQLSQEHELKLTALQQRMQRLEREHDTQRQRAHLPLAASLLPGLDDLERALDITRAHDDADLDHGLRMIRDSIHKALADHGITPIQADAAAPFDPEIHEAIAVVESEEMPDQAVHATLRTGWRHTTKVMRPAMVQINRNLQQAEVTFDFNEPAHEEEEEEKVEEPAPASAPSTS